MKIEFVKQAVKDGKGLSSTLTRRKRRTRMRKQRVSKFPLKQFKGLSRKVYEDVKELSQRLREIKKSQSSSIPVPEVTEQPQEVPDIDQTMEEKCHELLELLNGHTLDQISNLKYCEYIVKDIISVYLQNKQRRRRKSGKKVKFGSQVRKESLIYLNCREEELELIQILSTIDFHPFYSHFEQTIRATRAENCVTISYEGQNEEHLESEESSSNPFQVRKQGPNELLESDSIFMGHMSDGEQLWRDGHGMG